MSATSAQAAGRPSGRSGKVHPSRRTTSVHLSARAIVLLLVMAGVMLLGIAPLRGYLDARDQLAGLRRQAALLEQRNAKLETQIQHLNDPNELARLARACLGLVAPGETAFVVIPDHGRPLPPDC
jgi:cell division protein FtsB